MSLETAVTGLATLLADMADIKRVYSEPPESLKEFPSGIVYVREGNFDLMGGNAGRCNAVLVVDIYESRTVLAEAVVRSNRWPDRVRAKIVSDITLSGAVSHIGNSEYLFRFRSGAMRYGGAEDMYYGCSFEIPVKVNYAS